MYPSEIFYVDGSREMGVTAGLRERLVLIVMF